MDRLISEQAIINILMDNDLDHIQIKDGTELIQLVQAIPSAEPKTGHWIEEFNDLEGEVRFTCSSCGKYQLFETDYCYNCGAKMVELQESEE